MNNSATRPSPQSSAPLAGALSLVIPGAGQFYLGNRNRGLLILLTTIIESYLIYWARDNFKIGLVSAFGMQTSWLWLLLAVLWVWNVRDALAHAQGRRSANALWFVSTLAITYIIAWQVADVNIG
ncbi:MAG TPA: hypothetical protein VGA61_11890, partial [Anaerolineae bacterium]